MNEECCNHNCNQGRDCPLRKKTLTDEEILQQALFSFGNESENFDDFYWIDFARAILRKAQER